MGASSHGIINPRVIRVCRPEGSRSHVFVQQAGRGAHKHSEIILKRVADLNAVLEEERASPYVVDDRALDRHVITSVRNFILVYARGCWCQGARPAHDLGVWPVYRGYHRDQSLYHSRTFVIFQSLDLTLYKKYRL